MEKYIKKDYADLKGVNPSVISQYLAIGKLKTEKNKVGRLMIVDCEENDNLFKRKAHNAKRK